jgi:hypothetical protein
MRWSAIVVVAASLGVAMAAPRLAAAQQGEAVETFVCESANNAHRECAYRATGMVTVHVNRQLSRTRCVFNENWGTYDGGVWVDYGCRAEFVVRRPPQTRTYRPVGGTFKTVTCESRDRRQQQCPVPGIDAGSVSLERQLSGASCVRGVSWGVSEGENSPAGIWVDQGCRATFAYTTRGPSYTPWGGTPQDFEMPCESLRGQWNHCEVHHVGLARVEIVAGNDECHAYKAWGVDDTGIWVRANCQGAFRIKYRH